MIKRIFFILLMVVSSQAYSATVSYTFSGTINIADITTLLDKHGISVSVGDSFNGTFTYDTDAPLQSPTGISYRTDYQGTINSNISVTIGSYAYKVENPFGYEMLVYNDDINDGGSDHIAFSTTQKLTSPFSTTGGHIGINLLNISGTALDSTSIPTILNGSDWSGSHVTIIGEQTNSNFVLSGGIDSLTVVSSVPIPPALYLFGVGLLSLIRLARKRK